MKSDISVVIPLYNKEKEVAATLRSVLVQSVAPREIIVVDDGSTDGGAAIVNAIAAENSRDVPTIRLITQSNSGVSAARNRGVEEAAGKYVALLDADDTWEPRYLESMTRLITAYTGCGMYTCGFNIVRHGKKYLAKSPATEGVVEDFFREAMSAYICTPSTVTIPRDVYLGLGGFPAGMKIGEDAYLWIRLATGYRVCFTPDPLTNYSATASNRSARNYTPEDTAYSFEDLYRPEDDGSFRNEFIARCAISKALTLTSKGDTQHGLRVERFFAYTALYRRSWHRLRILNRLPAALRPAFNDACNRLAWAIARKGL